MGVFGWSYPAGCDGVPDDAPCGCEVCHRNVDDCACPECPQCGTTGDPKCYEEHGLARPATPPVGTVCVVDVDEAEYAGDDDDGCYYDAEQGSDGKWYTSVLVDSETGSFVDTIAVDDGPYDTREAAMEAGRVWAENWCCDNGVVLDDEPTD